MISCKNIEPCLRLGPTHQARRTSFYAQHNRLIGSSLLFSRRRLGGLVVLILPSADVPVPADNYDRMGPIWSEIRAVGIFLMTNTPDKCRGDWPHCFIPVSCCSHPHTRSGGGGHHGGDSALAVTVKCPVMSNCSCSEISERSSLNIIMVTCSVVSGGVIMANISVSSLGTVAGVRCEVWGLSDNYL